MEILKGLKFLLYVDFTDIVQCVFLKSSSESCALAHQVVQMQDFQMLGHSS